MCAVLGGPEYEIGLKGETSVVSYGIDRLRLHVGKVELGSVAQADFYLSNTGRVPFDFKLDTRCVSVSPFVAGDFRSSRA